MKWQYTHYTLYFSYWNLLPFPYFFLSSTALPFYLPLMLYLSESNPYRTAYQSSKSRHNGYIFVFLVQYPCLFWIFCFSFATVFLVWGEKWRGMNRRGRVTYVGHGCDTIWSRIRKYMEDFCHFVRFFFSSLWFHVFFLYLFINCFRYYCDGNNMHILLFASYILWSMAWWHCSIQVFQFDFLDVLSSS